MPGNFLSSPSDYASQTFNADDRAATLNGGSYRDIPLGIRRIVNREFEAFIHSQIDAQRSFALETTLRSDITFEQAQMARANGFRVAMTYVALANVEQHLSRVAGRAALGGHAASEGTLRIIYAKSLGNLPKALQPQRSGIEIIDVYDNSANNHLPELIVAARRGRVTALAPTVPTWLQNVMGWNEKALEDVRASLGRGTALGS